MSETQQTRDPREAPHVGDVLVAPYPHDCDERLRETIRVVKTQVRDLADKPSLLVAVSYTRGALRVPRERSIEDFRRQFADWDVRQIGA